MKKALLVALALFASVAQAEDNRNFIKLDAVHYNYTSAPNDKNGYNLTLGREVAPGIKLDVKQEARVEENSQKFSSRYETGAQLDEKILGLAVSVRGALGEKFVEGDNFAYWSVEPSVGYAVNDAWTVKSSWRYRNAFDSVREDQTNTYKVGVDYKYTSNVILGAALGRTTGDSEYTSLQGGVAYKF